jgi:hypothetical protein
MRKPANRHTRTVPRFEIRGDRRAKWGKLVCGGPEKCYPECWCAIGCCWTLVAKAGKTNAARDRRDVRRRYLRAGASLRFSSSLFTPAARHHQHRRSTTTASFDQDLRHHHRNNETTNGSRTNHELELVRKLFLYRTHHGRRLRLSIPRRTGGHCLVPSSASTSPSGCALLSLPPQPPALAGEIPLRGWTEGWWDGEVINGEIAAN